MQALSIPLQHPIAIVQGEWDQTLQRLAALVRVVSATREVNNIGYAQVTLRLAAEHDLYAVEQMIFDNLLFCPMHRNIDQHSVTVHGRWLWRWRKAVPWTCHRVGHMSGLAPDAPANLWTYAFNLVDADL